MTREEFDSLVRQVEAGIGERPAALRWRVAWLAALGYSVLLAGFLLVALIAGAFFAAMFWADLEGKIVCGIAGVIVLCGGGWAVLKALLVRVPPPEGVSVSVAETPLLFAMLDELQSRLRCVPFHRVLIVPVHNAAVVQVPRLGVFGWSRNYLLLGLPLLDAHSPEELRAILAHEFAHLSRQHGRFSHWIYRLRRSWERIFEQLAQPRVRGEVSLRPLLVKLFNRFWPNFNAHAFVFSRANEYEADSLAASLAGADSMAGALIRLALHDRLLDQKFWPGLWQLANTQPAPPPDVFVRLRDALRRELPAEDRAQWMAEALRLPTTNADTHPCLTDRLRALGCSLAGGDAGAPRNDSGRDAGAPGSAGVLAGVFAAPQSSAAEALLGASLVPVRSKIEELWRKNIASNWQARHARAAALSHRLASLDHAATTTFADADTLWDKACLLLDLEGGKTAEPLLRQVLSLRPDHVPANFHLGRILLEQGRPEGEAPLERAVAAEDDLVPKACALLHQHYRRAGRMDRLREVEARLDRYERDLAASRAERREVTARDKLIPHGLSDGELNSLRAALAAETCLKSAELARKDLRFFPNQKLFLLCVRRSASWFAWPDRTRDQEVVDRLSQMIRLPGRVLVFSPSGGFRALAKKLRQVAGAEVFRRKPGHLT